MIIIIRQNCFVAQHKIVMKRIWARSHNNATSTKNRYKGKVNWHLCSPYGYMTQWTYMST